MSVLVNAAAPVAPAEEGAALQEPRLTPPHADEGQHAGSSIPHVCFVTPTSDVPRWRGANSPSTGSHGDVSADGAGLVGSGWGGVLPGERMGPPLA